MSSILIPATKCLQIGTMVLDHKTMRVDGLKHAYKGWHEVAVAAGKPIFSNGYFRQADMPKDMRDWLDEHVGKSARDTWVERSSNGARIVMFKHADKAMLFKLTWA